MGLGLRRRNVVVLRSSAHSAASYGALTDQRPARAGQIRRCVRISFMLTVIAVRPRWRPLLAGLALTVAGALQRDSPAGVVVVFGILLLLQSVLIPASPDADRRRRCALERELATYSTPAQRCDLEATLDRYPDSITGEMREILTSQAPDARDSGIPGAGRH